MAVGRRRGRRARRSTSSGPIAAASSTPPPSAISATAAAAARLGAQPSASKVDPLDDPVAETESEIRIRSPQGAPPAEPVKEPSGAGPRRVESSQVVLDG